jgi:hypothetical protein
MSSILYTTRPESMGGSRLMVKLEVWVSIQIFAQGGLEDV